MRLAGILLSGQPETDMGAADDQRRARVFFGRVDGRVDGFDIVTIRHMQDLPAICLKTRSAILGEGEFGRAVDRDVVVVVEINEFAQF